MLISTRAGFAAPADAAEDEAHWLTWRPEWRRFDWIDATQTVVTMGAYVYVEHGIEPREARWTGPILFDEAVRDALVADSADGRNRAALISDITWYAPMALPFVESALIPLAFDDWNWDIAWQLTAMNLQAASVVALLTRFGHRVVLRERPDTEPCKADPDYDQTCFGGQKASFPSGHGSAAMLGAGLLCAHHSQLPLYGGGFPDVGVCVLAMAFGLANNVARLYADRHYATDVIAGDLIGFGAGFGMPVLLHYHGVGSFDARGPDAARWTIVPFTAGDGLGLGVYGWL